MVVADRYFEAWNAHDPEALEAALGAGATFRDRTTSTPPPGSAIRRCAEELFHLLPDAVFHVDSLCEAGPEILAARWTLQGTRSGLSDSTESAQTKAVTLRGVDFLAFEDGKLSSVERYVDRTDLVGTRQAPAALVPSDDESGYGVRLHVGGSKKPGAFSLTQLELSSDEEMAELANFGAAIQAEMASMPGLVTLTTFAVGKRAFSVAAWEHPDHARQMMGQGPHREAMATFFSGGIGLAGWTSVWVPERFNPLWVRCSACRSVVDVEGSGGRCACGQAFPETLSYW